MARDAQCKLSTRAGSVGAACAALLLAGCGVLLTPHHRLERAQREIQAGQWQDAAVDLRVVVQKEPKNAQAWLLLAQLSLDAADLTGAQSGLTHAVAAGAKGPKVDILRASIWLEKGEARQLLDALAQHRIALPEPDETLDTARALLATGEPAEALAKVQPLLAAHPHLTAARDIQAEALAAQSQLTAALRQLDAALAQDQKSPEPALLKGLILQQQGQYPAAQGALEDALKRMSPAEPILHRVKALIALTEVRLALGELKGAAASEAAVAKLEPQSPATALLDARLKIAQRNLEGGVAELEQLVVAVPHFTEARLLLGATLLQRGDLQQAQQQLQQVVQSTPDNLAARKLLAQVQLKLGQPEGALSVLGPALATDRLDPQLLSLYGAAASRTGDKQALIEALKRSEHDHPHDQTVLLNLGAAYLAAGQAEQALAVLQKTHDSGNVRRDQLLIAALTSAQGPEAAGAEAAKLLAAHPRDPAVLDLAATYDATQGRLEAARKLLRSAVAINPDDVRSQVDLARLDVLAGDPAAGESRLQAMLKAHPAALPARLGLANVLAGAKRYDDARKVLEGAGAHAGPQVQLALAQVALAGGDLKAANAALDRTIAEQPGHASPVEEAGLVLMNANQYDAALARFAQATQLAPKNPLYWLNTARAQLALNQPLAARSSLEKADALQPHWLPVVGTLAYTYLRQPAAAGMAYAQAQTLRPTSQLAVSLYRERMLAHATEPQQPLEQWLARDPKSVAVRDLLGEYYLGAGKPQLAVPQFKMVLAESPNDVVALNNLAWALNETGNPAAVALAQRAYHLAPNVPSVADTLGWVLTRNGQAQGAIEYLKRAAKLDPSDPDVQYHLAYALAKTGHRGEARHILGSILSSRKPFDSRPKAQQLLTSVRS